ncbi:N-acetyl-gamma-glutamyl-phosphate reductase [Halalkalibacterium ligniniphilum]|uniref:N-acetyl-gamma-glutamyl-phosphate reductase n=1 Tax=Halalkalibacterium ligniniphilum TaxID=1134413 RepID=UPI000347D71D|nr:N-acetyl-gamma-glutamyl-phosphate reductase [Halalkalibacterium ligniniphilum]
MNVAIIGATGYGGAELIRFLTRHPNVTSMTFYSSSQEGTLLAQTYPHLQAVIEEELQTIDADMIASQADVVFLATPPGVSAELSGTLSEKGLQVIDLSGDLRLKEQEVYESWYQRKAAPASVINQAVYGLAEWNRDSISKAQVISNPGCYPTAILLGLGPLVNERLIDPKTIIIDAKSGTSGAGRNPSAITHFSEMNENFKIYQVNKHKHTPEIEQMLKSWNEDISTVTFTPHLIPMVRGIMATMYAQAVNPLTEAKLRTLYEEMYQHSPFVRIRPEGVFPATKEVYGSNFCDIGITYDERTGRITVVSVIDNLVKGASGQAIQNFNLMNGWDETLGLEGTPLYP